MYKHKRDSIIEHDMFARLLEVYFSSPVKTRFPQKFKNTIPWFFHDQQLCNFYDSPMQAMASNLRSFRGIFISSPYWV